MQNTTNFSDLQKEKKQKKFFSYSVAESKVIEGRSAKRVLGYPETLAKSCNGYKKPTFFPDISNDINIFEKFLKVSKSKEEPDKIYRCSKGFLWGETTKNNYYKIITCGKEWCPDCGKFNSIPHSRRIEQNVPRFLALLYGGILKTGEKTEGNSIQYLVITVPKELRQKFKSHQVLNDFRTYWRRKLKNEGYAHGLTRYHWAGEDGFTWKPHLNILVPGGWIDMEDLKIWRDELSQWFKNYFDLDYKPLSNIYTAFTSEEGKVKHWVSYILRPTQIIYNEQNENTIKGFRNTAPFGQNWPQLPENEEDIAKKALSGYEVDPETGEREKIVWRKKWSELKQRFVPDVVPIQYVRIEDSKIIGRGMWQEPRFKPDNPPPEIPIILENKNIILQTEFCPF